MKKIMLIMLLGVLSLTSCKKDLLVCECDVTVTDKNNNITKSETYRVTVKKQTKKQAQRGECSSYRINADTYTEYKRCEIIYEYD